MGAYSLEDKSVNAVDADCRSVGGFVAHCLSLPLSGQPPHWK